MPSPYDLSGHNREHETSYRNLTNVRPLRCGVAIEGSKSDAVWGGTNLAPGADLTAGAQYVRVRVSGLRLVRAIVEVSADFGGELQIHRIKPNVARDGQGTTADRYDSDPDTVSIAANDTEYPLELEPKGEEFFDIAVTAGTITFLDIMGT